MTPEDHDFLLYTQHIPIQRTNGPDKKIRRADLSSDQETACLDILERIDHCQLVSLGGYAGTGKSTIIPIISNELGDAKHTAFCAFTGKAANVLQRKLRASSLKNIGYIGTIHRLIYQPLTDLKGRIVGWQQKDKPLYIENRHGEAVPIKRIIIDEVSMVGQRLLEDLQDYDIPIFAVGDHGQLPPVMDLSILEDPDVRLEKIHRQAADNPIIKLATAIREQGDIPKGFPSSENIRFIKKAESFEVMGETYERLGLNMAILVRRNVVRKTLNTAPRNNPYPEPGDVVICLKNNPPIYNGMRGLVQEMVPYEQHWYKGSVVFPDDGLIVSGLFNKHQFGRDKTLSGVWDLQKEDIPYPYTCPLGMLFDFGTAMTVHKSQGSAFEEVILCPERWSSDEPEDYARWLYTAVTRAVNKLTIVR